MLVSLAQLQVQIGRIKALVSGTVPRCAWLDVFSFYDLSFVLELNVQPASNYGDLGTTHLPPSYPLLPPLISTERRVAQRMEAGQPSIPPESGCDASERDSKLVRRQRTWRSRRYSGF